MEASFIVTIFKGVADWFSGRKKRRTEKIKADTDSIEVLRNALDDMSLKYAESMQKIVRLNEEIVTLNKTVTELMAKIDTLNATIKQLKGDDYE